MKCPHCTVEFHDEARMTLVGQDIDSAWGIISHTCPKCERLILTLAKGKVKRDSHFGQIFSNPTDEVLIRPKTSNRTPVPPQVPSEFIEDYQEACLVLTDSPKASAALSRRCLQYILQEKAGVTHRDLAQQIQEVIDSNTLPSYIAESIDAIRNIGNFAAHPIKSKSTGEIVSVEPGEAEWSLDVIEMLYDFYFVQPTIIQQKRDALNQTLVDAGKPLMK